MNPFTILSQALGSILHFIYNFIAFGNYGLAIILFTVVVKMLLLPLTIKQTQSASKMQEIQPKIKEIQKRYKNDKEKLNKEMMRVYQENKVNPAGGCLPLLIQMPIIFSLFQVIRHPLQHLMKLGSDSINTLSEYVSSVIGEPLQSHNREIDIINYFNEHIEELKQFSEIINPEKLINFNFLGLNLGLNPTIDSTKLFGEESVVYLPLLLIPILGVITTYISSKMMTPKTADAGKGGTSSSMANSMLYVGPALTLLFSFQLPAGVGLYWIASYIFQIFQQLYINKFIKKKKEEPDNK